MPSGRGLRSEYMLTGLLYDNAVVSRNADRSERPRNLLLMQIPSVAPVET
jgi:hypothetical protein